MTGGGGNADNNINLHPLLQGGGGNADNDLHYGGLYWCRPCP